MSEKTFNLECTSDAGEVFLDAPEVAVVSVSKHGARRIKELSDAVVKLDVWAVEEFDYSPEIYERNWNFDEPTPRTKNPLNADPIILKVDKDEFWWRDGIKHTDIEWSTSHIKISEIEELL